MHAADSRRRVAGATVLVASVALVVGLAPSGAYGAGGATAPLVDVSEVPTTPEPSETLTPSGTVTPTSTPTPTPTESLSPTSTATASASPTESEPEQSESGTSESPTSSPAATRHGSAPAVTDSSIGVWSVVLAALVLLIAGGLLWLVYRREDAEATVALPALPGDTVEQPSVLAPAPETYDSDLRGGNERIQFLVDLGEAMIDSGAPVTHVQTVLHEVADTMGVGGAEVVVLPTVLLVSVPGGTTTQTAVAVAGTRKFRLDQIDAVYQVAAEASSGELVAHEGRERLSRTRDLPPPRGPLARTLGYVVLTLGLALLLGGNEADLLVAAGLGLGVGLVQLLAPRLPLAYSVFAPVVCSFGVGLAVFLLARSDLDVGVFAPLIAPLVTFLPGALLTTSAIELATGQMISGAGRLAAGAMQLVLLAIGIVAAAQLVGVPASEIEGSGHGLGAIAPWIGVAVFGVGMVLHQCARPSSLGWILLVLYVAYAGQVIGGLFFGGVLSAFFGAMAMTPVAMFAASQRNGPPALVSFLPAFWLLVPGALGLLGVTAFIGDDRIQGVTTLVTTASTMVSIALGVLVGLAAGGLVVQVAQRAGARRRSDVQDDA